MDGFICEMSTTGTANTTFRWYEDGSGTGITCIVGSGNTTCASPKGIHRLVSAGTVVAMGAKNNTDNLSADDYRCKVYVSPVQ
jgi:hypothetical protein